MSTHLVLLHGFAGAPSSWEAVVARLPRQWRIDRPAVSGHDGEREWPQGVERFDDEVDRLAGLIEAGPGGAVLCGYSMGGRLALGLLARHRALWRSALVIGAHPGLPEAASERRERVAADERWARRIETDLDGFAEAWAQQPLFASQRSVAPADLAAQEKIRRGHRPDGLARAMRVLSLGAMPDRWPALRANRTPLVAMAGELDHKFAALAAELGRKVPGARCALVPGVGHNVPLEAPAAVAHALRELAGESSV